MLPGGARRRSTSGADVEGWEVAGAALEAGGEVEGGAVVALVVAGALLSLDEQAARAAAPEPRRNARRVSRTTWYRWRDVMNEILPRSVTIPSGRAAAGDAGQAADAVARLYINRWIAPT
jgi:hypothetical protein